MKTSLLSSLDRYGLQGRGLDPLGTEMTNESQGRLVNATEFQQLIVSHRRMERVACQQRLRGLRDLDTGEVFLTDERRLLEARR